MKLIGALPCLLAAPFLLAGCGTWSVSSVPGSVSFNIGPAAEGDKYQLTCLESYSGSCHIRIETANDGIHYATAVAGTTQILEHAETGARFCISDSDPGSLICRLNRQYFAPKGSFIIRS